MDTGRVGVIYNQPVGQGAEAAAEAGVLVEMEAVRCALELLGQPHTLYPVGTDLPAIIARLHADPPDVAVNLCEMFPGTHGGEMYMPGVLELLGIPYTGSTPLTIGICLHKGFTKHHLASSGVPVPDFVTVRRLDDKIDVGFPLIVKPLYADASRGIHPDSVVFDEAGLRRKLRYVLEDFGQPAIVERFIGGREFKVATFGNRPPRTLPLSEVDYYPNMLQDLPSILGYDAKWNPESLQYKGYDVVCPASIEDDLARRLREVAMDACLSLGCRDYARVDLRADEEENVYVLDVNPNPDISPDSGYMSSWEATGKNYADFVSELLGFVRERARNAYPPDVSF